MTIQQFEQANAINRKLRAIQHLLTDTDIEVGNFNFLYTNDEEFRADIQSLKNKYTEKYTELFRSL